MNGCEQYRDLYEAAALGALDPAERAAFDAHLATGCATCARAMEEARWLVTQLAYLAPDARPSPMLKARLVQTVRAEARLPARASTLFWMWAGVAALILLSLYSAWQVQRLRRDLADLQAQSTATGGQRARLERERADAQRTALILADPSSVQVAMPQTAQKDAPPMRAYWNTRLGIVVAGVRIPLPASQRTLELWLVPKAPDGKPVPAGYVRPQDDGTFVLLVANPAAPLAATKALAVTDEPEGGSSQPTTAPRWLGFLDLTRLGQLPQN